MAVVRVTWDLIRGLLESVIVALIRLAEVLWQILSWVAWQLNLLWMRFDLWWAPRWPRIWVTLRPTVSVLAVMHLVGVAWLPGGENKLFNWSVRDKLGYTTLYPMIDTFGFWVRPQEDIQLRYQIYTQEGTTHKGLFPDPAIGLQVRYDRWALATQYTAGASALNHAAMGRFLASQTPSTPFKVALSSVTWRWHWRPVAFPPSFAWEGEQPQERSLGAYNGLTKQWESGDKTP
ncbi:MAG: hypothetical protein OEV94_05735 [Deltaproteobacteria bacterium]|nr:hypothetical protein [Deltaproteobacteria bacterium]